MLLLLGVKVSTVKSVFNITIVPLYSASIVYSVCVPSNTTLITCAPFSVVIVGSFNFSPFAINILEDFKSTFLIYEGNFIFNVGFVYNALLVLDVSNVALISTFSFFTTVDKSFLLTLNSTTDFASVNGIFNVADAVSV